MADERHSLEERGRVLPFRTRERSRAPQPDPRIKPVEDLRRYARSAEEPDDYRHRQITNALAFAVCVVLVVIGVWLADAIAQWRRDQDCVLSGRRNCAPITLAPSHEGRIGR